VTPRSSPFTPGPFFVLQLCCAPSQAQLTVPPPHPEGQQAGGWPSGTGKGLALLLCCCERGRERREKKRSADGERPAVLSRVREETPQGTPFLSHLAAPGRALRARLVVGCGTERRARTRPRWGPRKRIGEVARERVWPPRLQPLRGWTRGRSQFSFTSLSSLAFSHTEPHASWQERDRGRALFLGKLGRAVAWLAEKGSHPPTPPHPFIFSLPSSTHHQSITGRPRGGGEAPGTRARAPHSNKDTHIHAPPRS